VNAEGRRTVDSEAQLYEALGPTLGRGRAIALIGGADGLDTGDTAALEGFFLRLADHLERTGTAVVDGGTDSGVMRMIAAARRARGAGFRLVGVVPEGALDRTTRDGLPIDVAPDHDIVVVPGMVFGDESPWLFAAADHLAAGVAPTIVVNGGRLTLDEAGDRLANRALVIVVAGSGRAADELAADSAAPREGTLRVLPVTAGVMDITQALESIHGTHG
jgi:hypothetical protein